MSVAQLDRVTASDAVGSGFDSRRAHQNGSHPYGWLPFWHDRRKRTRRVRASEATLRRGDPFRGFGGFPIYQKRRHPCGCRRFCMPAGSDHIRVRADVGSRARAAIGRDALPRLPKGNGNSAKPDLYLVTLRSSSLAYAVSILPNGKMHDLQGGSSSSQKSRFAAIFGSPVFEPRSRTGLACCVSVTDAFAVFGTFFAFCTRSLRSLRSVGMTGGGV